MSKRDYKVATTDGIELEPLGGEKSDKDKDKDKEKQTNGVTFGESPGTASTTLRACNCNFEKEISLITALELRICLLGAHK